MHLDDSVHDGYIPAIDVEDHDFPSAERLPPHVQEQDVPSIECRLHATTEHHHHLQGDPKSLVTLSAAVEGCRMQTQALYEVLCCLRVQEWAKTHAAETSVDS